MRVACTSSNTCRQEREGFLHTDTPTIRGWVLTGVPHLQGNENVDGGRVGMKEALSHVREAPLRLQGCLPHKKQHPPRTLQQDYA